MRFIVAFALSAFVVSCMSPGQVMAEKVSRTVKFTLPDIKNDFCGVRMDYRYCKCAFHGEFCKDIGRERTGADFIVLARFERYVADLRAAFANTCRANGGRFSEDRCEYVERTKDETACLPKDFGSHWKKYSDLDDAIPVADRSFEARSHAETLAKIVENAKEIFFLQRDMEIDRHMRLELRNYKQALVQNIKTNLLKSFWRLAWITYDNIQSGRASGGTFEKMYDLPSVGESLAAYIKTVRSVTPGDSAVAINTEKVSGKVASVGLSTALDALESVGDPATVATTLVSESVKQTFPSADITPEEIEILKNQHLKSRVLDDLLQENYRENRERRLKAGSLKAENAHLAEQLVEWETKERTRVMDGLLKECDKK